MAAAPHPRGRWRTRPAGYGFTLVELLVVLVVVGVMIGLATLAVGDRSGEEVEREAERLAALLRLARDEAVLTARPLGLRVEPDRYLFLALEGEDRWRPLASDRVLHPRALSEVVELTITVEGRRGLLAVAEDEDRDENEGLRPQVLVLETGEMTPFEITVRARAERGRYFLLEGGLDGAVRLQAEG